LPVLFRLSSLAEVQADELAASRGLSARVEAFEEMVSSPFSLKDEESDCATSLPATGEVSASRLRAGDDEVEDADCIPLRSD